MKHLDQNIRIKLGDDILDLSKNYFWFQSCSHKVWLLLQSNNKNGKPQIKDFYDYAWPRNAISNWGAKIWRKGIQPRRSILVQKLLHKKLATEDILKTRGFYMASWCRFCCKEKESISYNFLNCFFSRSLWKHI